MLYVIGGGGYDKDGNKDDPSTYRFDGSVWSTGIPLRQQRTDSSAAFYSGMLHYPGGMLPNVACGGTQSGSSVRHSEFCDSAGFQTLTVVAFNGSDWPLVPSPVYVDQGNSYSHDHEAETLMLCPWMSHATVTYGEHLYV
eukprot:454969-Prymnesium_polylepis.1